MNMLIFLFKDEILKAAVMKYGKNQWSRIASLLHRKSAKQCKARWFEWLDPSIKKTEWSREEDEKLLHMAKLMPTQWRTIAPIVGRTAAQCLERYEYLLDKAQKKAFEGTSSALDDEHEDPRKLKPGEIDPNPETKPARPDPIDMDEDELEMLSEARARLANTQGKKAKRKARERQLEEARRLAALQKRRELKAAGIELRRYGKKRREVEYNKEIPFAKAPAIGFYDAESDVFDKESIKIKQQKENLENKNKSAQKDAAINSRKRKENEPQPTSLNDFADKVELTRKRSKLVLPAPQISDRELEDVVKLGLASEQAHQQAQESGPTPQITGQLLANYQLTPDLTRLRTPALPSSQDTILTESQNLLALQLVDTPLKGGLNTPLQNNGVAATPLNDRKPVQTPNTMFTTPFRTPHGEVNATPTRTPMAKNENSGALVLANQSVQQTPGTNIRDKLSINPEEGLLDDKVRHREYLDKLKKGLSKLPAPKNDYEIVLPDEEEPSSAKKPLQDEEMLEENDKFGEQYEEMDQTDLENKMREEMRLRREEEMKYKSRSIQRNLPRPSDMNHNILRPSDMLQSLNDYQRAEEMIKQEILVMLHHDAINDPTLNQCGIPVGSKKPANINNLKPLQFDKHLSYVREHGFERFSLDEMSNARDLVEKEIPYIKKLMGHGELTSEAFGQVWDECYSQVMFVPSSNRFTRASVTSRKDKIESYEKKLEVNRFHMSVEAKKAAKLEQKLKITLGGYQSRAQVLIKSLQDIYNQIESKQVELTTFENIREHEQLGINKRIESLKEDVNRQAEREKELQKKFGDLLLERDSLKCQ